MQLEPFLCALSGGGRNEALPSANVCQARLDQMVDDNARCHSRFDGEPAHGSGLPFLISGFPNFSFQHFTQFPPAP
jgi:hypothetical protein